MSDHLGMGVMIGLLGGNDESAEAFSKAVGKTIAKLELIEDDSLAINYLRFTFTDETTLDLYDDGQSCCEDRYMRTDDNLTYYVGSKLISAETRNAPDIEDESGVHEVQFLIVTTDKGQFTMANHNEHNGYYGGFLIRAK